MTRRTSVTTTGRLGRTALLALAACGPPNCPKADSAPHMQVVTLPDGGTELQPMPIAIYGTAPPCK